MPRVSVIIPTHNGSEWIEESIKSVKFQDIGDIEIIVVSDGSTDDTRSKVSAIPGVIFIEQENSGPAVTRNTGIRAASGKYIALMDDDDLWMPDKLARQLHVLDEHPEIGVMFCNYEPFGNPAAYKTGFDRGPVLETIPRIALGESAYLLDKPTIFLDLLKDLFSWTSTLVIRRECLDKSGLYDESLRYAAEDRQLCLRLSKYCQFGFIDMVLARRRERGGSLSRQGRDTQQAVLALTNLLGMVPLDREERCAVYQTIADLERALGYENHLNYEMDHARKHLISSLKTSMYILLVPGWPKGMLKSVKYLLTTFLPVNWVEKIRAMKEREE